VPLGHPEPFTSNPFIQVGRTRLVHIAPHGHAGEPTSHSTLLVCRAPFTQILGVVLSALGMLEATLFAGAALWLRKTKPMRSSSPLFMYLICFGGLCACVGVLMVSIAPITRHTCAAFLWVPTLARILILGCLFAKTHRIYKLFANKVPAAASARPLPPIHLTLHTFVLCVGRLQSLKRLVISDIDVLRRVLAILIPWMVFLATWQFINPFRTVEVETPPTARGERFTYVNPRARKSVTYVALHRVWSDRRRPFLSIVLCLGCCHRYLACGAEHSPMPWEIANAVGALLLYAWGAFLAFETRKVPADFNESRWVAACRFLWPSSCADDVSALVVLCFRRIMLAIYNALVVGLVGAGLSFVLRDVRWRCAALRSVAGLLSCRLTMYGLATVTRRSFVGPDRVRTGTSHVHPCRAIHPEVLLHPSAQSPHGCHAQARGC